MKRFLRRLSFVLFAAAVFSTGVSAQQALTWQEVRDKFEAANPTLRAGGIGVDESRAQEITAFLRPNPNLTLSTDGTQLARYHGVWQPLTGTQFSSNFSYLHERQRKRELRLESAQKGYWYRNIGANRFGAKSCLQLTNGVCANSSGKSDIGIGEGKSRVLRPRTGRKS